jgi:hypothetical protein
MTALEFVYKLVFCFQDPNCPDDEDEEEEAADGLGPPPSHSESTGKTFFNKKQKLVDTKISRCKIELLEVRSVVFYKFF